MFKIEVEVCNKTELMRLLETMFKVPKSISPYVALDMMTGKVFVSGGVLVSPLDHMPYDRFECGVWFHATGYEYWDSDRKQWEIQYEDDLAPEESFDDMFNNLLGIAPNWRSEDEDPDDYVYDDEVDLFPDLEIDFEF